LTFAESALYLASRNNNNWTTEWTTNKRHVSAGKSVGIKRLQKKARRSSYPDHSILNSFISIPYTDFSCTFSACFCHKTSMNQAFADCVERFKHTGGCKLNGKSGVDFAKKNSFERA